MADEDGLYLENLEEFINDEDRIVTYKWLSRTLSVSSNQAKQMLYTYLVKQREDKNANNISATYLVGGRCNVDDEMIQQFILTNDTNLDDTKSCFDVITSVHVYSLQKNKPKDSNAFYTVDYNIKQEHKDDSNRWNHIYCKEAKPFNDGGVNRGHLQGKSGKENSKPVGSASIVNGQGSTNHNSSNDKPKSTNQKSKKGQLPNMGMFARKEEKKDVALDKDEKPSETSKDKSNDIEKKQKSTKSSKQGGSMLSFFGKPVSETCVKKEEKLKDKSPEKRQEIEKPKEKPSGSKDTSKKLEENKKTTKDTQEIHSKRKESKTTPEHKKESKKTPENKPKESKKTSKQNRRRIKNLDSSDEEDEEPIPKKPTKLASDSESNSEEDVLPKKVQGKKKKVKQEESTSKKKSISKKEKVNKDSSKKDENEAKSNKMDRKRKKEMSSSSSEEEAQNRSKSNCTVVSETPVAVQRSTGNPVKRRKRRKVMRSKTYIDDDGFMVTEKVYESESEDASDEEPVPVKQESGPNHEAKKTSPESKSKKITEMKPAKQASLMSFFKKS